jgi:hypothetical protein
VGVAAPQEATFQVAELVEQEERVIAGAAEVGSQRQLSDLTRREPHDHAPSVVPIH